jgi:serine phosphatase RsbU (regulator of sigma subunit)
MTVVRDAEELDFVWTSSVFGGFKVSTRIMPAHSARRGGDWCETFALSKHVVALSIGDVCGHGLAAFEAMLLTRQFVRDGAAWGLDPSQTLAQVNQALCREERGFYATAIFGLLDTRRNTFTFANAGHPPPLLAGAFGEYFLEFGNGDLLLGMSKAAIAQLHVVTIPAETLLVLYTDGIIERQRDVILGQRQLRNAATLAYRSSALSAAPVIERQMFLAGSSHDDAALLTARAPSPRMYSTL